MAAPHVDELHLPALPDPAAVVAALPAGPGRFLLESAMGGAGTGRFSLIGCRPFRTLTVRGQGAAGTGGQDPLDALQESLAACRQPLLADLPLPAGAAVGYLSYDLGRCIERIPSLACDDLRLPDLVVGFYDVYLALDHSEGAAYIVAAPLPGRVAAAREQARLLRDCALQAVGQQAAAQRTGTPRAGGCPTATQPAPAVQPGTGAASGEATGLRSTFTRPGYLAAVRKALDYIAAGDIYQVNLAQRCSAPCPDSGLDLYRRLRLLSPAPFAAFLDLDGHQVVSSSPERFLKAEPAAGAWRVETRPIKGTRPRGRDAPEDQRLAAELMASRKEQAELVMIVDLERNDLGRVCQYGTVQVADLRRLEAHPTVFHTVATVEGLLRPGVGVAGLLRATFPGGSITGAPKVRAMAIIEELEPVRRAVYTGAIGYFGFCGRTDLNIAIRTVTLKDGVAHFHVGGGIVADSDPAAEYDETLAKGKAMAAALGLELAVGEGVGR